MRKYIEAAGVVAILSFAFFLGQLYNQVESLKEQQEAMRDFQYAVMLSMSGRPVE